MADKICQRCHYYSDSEDNKFVEFTYGRTGYICINCKPIFDKFFLLAIQPERLSEKTPKGDATV